VPHPFTLSLEGLALLAQRLEGSCEVSFLWGAVCLIRSTVAAPVVECSAKGLISQLHESADLRWTNIVGPDFFSVYSASLWTLSRTSGLRLFEQSAPGGERISLQKSLSIDHWKQRENEGLSSL
jgi:hypothetical protein